MSQQLQTAIITVITIHAPAPQAGKSAFRLNQAQWNQFTYIHDANPYKFSLDT